MSQIFVGDIHLKNEELFQSIQRDFFLWLFKEWGGKGHTLNFLGDIFDNRKITSNFILTKTVDIFDSLATKFDEINIIVGNHDVITSHTNQNINILDKLFRGHKNINIYSKIAIKNNIIYFPYDFRGTEEFENIKKLENKQDYILAGHFETNLFYPASEFAMPMEFFFPFKYTFAGHVHLPYKEKNFNYVGTPFELCQNANGVEAERGIYVWDKVPEFHIYPNYKHYYTFKIQSVADIEKLKTQKIKGKHIRILVPEEFSTTYKKELKEALDVLDKNDIKIGNMESAVIEDLKNLSSVNIISQDDIKKAIYKFIDVKYTKPDKAKFKTYLDDLLVEFSEGAKV